MSELNEEKKFQQKWWLHPMDPENLPELSDIDRKNAKNFNGWLLIWGLMYFGISLAMEPLPSGFESTPVWRYLLAASPIISGILLVRAFITTMMAMKDELIKKVFYKAIAFGFLFAFFIGMCFNLSAEIIGHSHRAAPFTFAGLVLGYFLGLTLNYKKYSA